jgi:DUF4097 and DUF4098 domain-containing protein YvlB
MASPNMYPPPPPPSMPPPPAPLYPRRRSIAGPLILIVIGLLFFLRNFGFRFPIWHWFGHWWPVLLILWGVIALIEHSTANHMGYRTRHLGGGGIFLLILLVGLGVTAHYTSDTDWSGLRQQIQMDDDLGGIFGTAFSFEDTLQQSFPAHGNLRVVCDRGTLNISPSDDNTVRVVVHKKLYAQNQKDADKYNDQTRPQITVTGNSVLVNANTDGSGEHGVESDLDIFVPAAAMLDVAGKRGDVTVNERKADVKIALQHGDVELNDIGGAVKVSLEKGSLRASKITGDLDVDGRLDNVTIDEVAGAVHLNGDFYDDIRLSKIDKTVTFKTSRSDMQIASVPGDIEIASDEVRGSDLSGPSKVVTSSKNIHLEDISGDLEVESNNGNVEVSTAGKPGKMTVSTQHGDVSLTLASKPPADKVDVNTTHGDVTLTLPSNAGFQITAGTRKGDISSDFNAVKVDESNGTSHASGTVGNGVSKLQINTDTGDIKIGKG